MTRQIYGPSTTSDGGNRRRTAEIRLVVNKLWLCISSAKPPPLQGVLLNLILNRFRKVDSTHEISAGQHDWVPIPIVGPHTLPWDG